jgi:hypothetical protein
MSGSLLAISSATGATGVAATAFPVFVHTGAPSGPRRETELVEAKNL